MRFGNFNNTFLPVLVLVAIVAVLAVIYFSTTKTPVPFGTGPGLCITNETPDMITATLGGVLKDSPSVPNATSFDDPVYLSWVAKAAALEKAKNNGAKFITVWLDGGYRSFRTCPSVNPDYNITKTFIL
jgi:hypothetical protein